MIETHMPLDVARCRPEAYHCHKAHNCARATDWPLLGPTQHLAVVDASLCLPAGECPMFIDAVCGGTPSAPVRG